VAARRRCPVVARVPGNDRLLELRDGRTVGYATWGDPDDAPVFIGHGTPGSRLALSPGLDDPQWIRRQGLLFVGVDRPGYGCSDPWAEAGLLDCAGDLVRVADDLGLERFAALGFSGGAPYALALGVLAPQRLRGVAVVSGLGMLDRPGALEGMSEGDVEEVKMAREAPDELAAARGEGARAIREDPEGMLAGLSEELPGADRRALERPEVRAFLVETFREAVRQGAAGWIDDELRQVRPWPFRLEEVSGVDVRLHHGEADALVPAHHAKHLAEGIPGSRLQLYPGEGHLSLDAHLKEIVQALLAPPPDH
jgi:pimeloyl-ACP methyl ester carboxylesterase